MGVHTHREHDKGNPMWTGFLANYLVASACARLIHVGRSIPIKAHNSWVSFFCVRGKQQVNRNGFHWGAYAFMSHGWNWGKALIEDYMKLTDKAITDGHPIVWNRESVEASNKL